MIPRSVPHRAGRPGHTHEDLSTKERILRVAADLFARDGYTGVSIRDITQTVGIKESSLYNHFKNKEALLNAILDRMEGEFAARALTEKNLRSQIEHMTPEQFMRSSFERFMAFWNDPLRVHLWFVISMEQYRSARAGQLILDETRRVIDTAASAFGRMQEMKKILPLDPKLLAETYAGTLRGMQMELAILMSSGKETRSVKRRMNAFISFFSALIAA